MFYALKPLYFQCFNYLSTKCLIIFYHTIRQMTYFTFKCLCYIIKIYPRSQLIWGCFSQHSNQAKLYEPLGIQKKRLHHLARRTFATTVLLFNDVPMEIVSALLGHVTMSVTQDSYAKIVNKKIGSAMAVFYKGGEG